MRSDAPGFVLDASALGALPRSAYAQALIRMYARLDRPIVIPAAALARAAGNGTVDAADFDPPEFTVTALNQAAAPGLAAVLGTARAPMTVEAAHAVYEAATTGYPVVTADTAAYDGLTVPIDLEVLP